MASYDYLEARSLNRKGVVGNVVNDTSVPLRIRNTAGKTVTSVIIATAGNTLELIDSDGTTTIDFDTATTNTVGEVADTINATTNWECKILDGLRDDVMLDKHTERTMSPGSNTTMINGVEYYDIMVSTTALHSMTYRLTPSREILIDPPKQTRRVHLTEIAYLVDGAADAADGVRVYEVKDGVETQIYSGPFNTDTAETDNFASGQGYITGADNADLVVRVLQTTITGTATNYLKVTGEIE